MIVSFNTFPILTGTLRSSLLLKTKHFYLLFSRWLDNKHDFQMNKRSTFALYIILTYILLFYILSI